MKSSEYVKNAIKTESDNFSEIASRLQSKETIRLLHGAIGLGTESAELQDALKKHIFYGKPLDKVNIKEELGDLFWYLAIIANELDLSFEEIMARNIEKLKARYGEKFTEEKAENRDLKKERIILEK